jgi:hypothetical protein
MIIMDFGQFLDTSKMLDERRRIEDPVVVYGRSAD